jgi:SPP1 family predicted phage head-tail adaptor
MLRAGDLQERILVRRQVNVKNPSTGGLTRSWTDVGEMWAQIKALNGREAVIATTLQGVSTFQITVRYREDLQAADQVLWKGRELNIAAPPEDRVGDRKWTTMFANTLAPQGA